MKKQTVNSKPSFRLFQTSAAIRAALLLGKVLPRKTGLKIASLIGSHLGKNKDNPSVKAIRANQWVIHNQSLTEQELDAYPVKIYQSAARCLFDYFYYLSRPDKLQEVVDFSPEAKVLFERVWNNQACMIVVPHISNFDLMGYALRLNNLDVHALSVPNPNEAYKMQNRLREQVKIKVTPISVSALRQAKKRLESGKSVMTGFDRPLTGDHREKYVPSFFGYQSNLPVFYIRLAKEVNAPIFVTAATSQPGDRYLLEVSPPIWMHSAEDLETEILSNAQRVLRQAEPIIKKYADQWAMFYPVWPQFLGV